MPKRRLDEAHVLAAVAADDPPASADYRDDDECVTGHNVYVHVIAIVYRQGTVYGSIGPCGELCGNVVRVFVCPMSMSIVLFVILRHFLVARAIYTRVDSPSCRVLMTGRRYSASTTQSQSHMVGPSPHTSQPLLGIGAVQQRGVTLLLHMGSRWNWCI